MSKNERIIKNLESKPIKSLIPKIKLNVNIIKTGININKATIIPNKIILPSSALATLPPKKPPIKGPRGIRIKCATGIGIPAIIIKKESKAPFNILYPI